VDSMVKIERQRAWKIPSGDQWQMNASFFHNSKAI